jgi:hypothetical protein
VTEKNSSDQAAKIDVASDANRINDLLEQVSALIGRLMANADSYTVERAWAELDKFGMIGIDGVCSRAGQAFNLDSARFARSYGYFYASIESFDRTVQRIQELEEDQRASSPQAADAALSLVSSSLSSLHFQAQQFDEEMGLIRARDHVQALVPGDKPAEQAIMQSAGVDTTNIARVAASQLTISNAYYENVLSQARRSFNSAIAAAIVGLLFFLGAVAVAMTRELIGAASISALSGTIVEVIAGLNFWLYARTSLQLESFHLRLERMQRYLVANSVCENLRGKARDLALSELVATIANDRGRGLESDESLRESS